MSKVCCVCARTEVGGSWLKQAVGPDAFVSHGLCPACFEETRRNIGCNYRPVEDLGSDRQGLPEDYGCVMKGLD